jgi:hypothetical protein
MDDFYPRKVDSFSIGARKVEIEKNTLLTFHNNIMDFLELSGAFYEVPESYQNLNFPTFRYYL